MLELKGVCKYYSGSTVSLGLRNINLKFNKNEIVAIVGESGSGKSTLLNVISFMDTYEEGEILFNGNPTSYFNKDDMDVFRKNHIQYIPQNYNIIESYTVLENVMVPILLNNVAYDVAKEHAIDIINRVGLSSRINNKGACLSGGEKQRCVIARALASDCEILACDEPTGNLDSETGNEIMKLIKEVSKDKLVLIVTHNYEQVKHVVTRKITMFDGEVKSDETLKVIDSEESDLMTMVKEKMNFKSFIKMMVCNVTSTSKKLMLSILISFVFFFLALFMLLQCNKTYQNIKYTNSIEYANTIDNRLVVYKKDHSILNTDIIDSIAGEKCYNAFYEDIRLNFNTFKTEEYMSGFYSKHIPVDLKEELGSMPSNDSDLYLIVPEGKIEEYKNKLDLAIGDNIVFESYFLNDVKLKLCGVGSSKDISSNIILTKIDMAKYISRLYLSNLKATYERNNELINVDYTFTSNSKSEVIIVGPKEEWNDIYLTIKDIYKVKLNNYLISYDENNQSPTFGIALTLSVDFQFEEIYEAVIYAKNPESAKKKLQKAGFEVDMPGKNGVDYESDEYKDYLIFLGITAASVVAMLVISSGIISRIIDSKIRQYTILKSLGLVHEDMKKLLLCEIGFINIFALCLSIVVMSLLNAFGINLIEYVNILIALLITIATIFLCFQTYIKSSRRLFRNSVIQILNSEVLRK